MTRVSRSVVQHLGKQIRQLKFGTQPASHGLRSGVTPVLLPQARPQRRSPTGTVLVAQRMSSFRCMDNEVQRPDSEAASVLKWCPLAV